MAAHTGWGNAHILSPDLRLHARTHARTQSLTVTVLFCSCSHSKHHILALKTHSFPSVLKQLLSFSADPRCLYPLTATEPLWSCQSSPVVSLHPNTDSALSVLMTLHLSMPPCGHHLDTSTGLDRTQSPTTMTFQSTTINLLLIAALAHLSECLSPH